MRFFIATMATLLGAGCAAGAHAASFDCARAAADMEKAICADKALSARDDAMAKVYQADLARLSPEGRKGLRYSQRQFLDFASLVCSDAATKDVPDDAGMASCLSRRFRDRTDDLQDAIRIVGGHCFLYLTHYRARIVTDAGGDVVQEIATSVRIDAPQTASERAWNLAAQRREVVGLKAAHDFGDGAETFETDPRNIFIADVVVSASPDLIASVVVGSTSSATSAHADQTQNVAQIWSLRLGRVLTPSDILDDRTHWQKRLLPVAQAHLKADDPGQPLDDLAMDYVEPTRWQLKADGIHIVYPPYALGGYLSAAESVLDWKTLKPWLRRDLPFRPQELQSAFDGVVY